MATGKDTENGKEQYSVRPVKSSTTNVAASRKQKERLGGTNPVVSRRSGFTQVFSEQNPSQTARMSPPFPAPGSISKTKMPLSHLTMTGLVRAGANRSNGLVCSGTLTRMSATKRMPSGTISGTRNGAKNFSERTKASVVITVLLSVPNVFRLNVPKITTNHKLHQLSHIYPY